jgi:ABC-2 type transport system ATP-binding protein
LPAGAHGAGKTTLLKLLAEHIAASEGSVAVNGKAVAALAMPEEALFVETGAAQFNMQLASLFMAAADINPSFDLSIAMELAARFKLDMCLSIKKYSVWSRKHTAPSTPKLMGIWFREQSVG